MGILGKVNKWFDQNANKAADIWTPLETASQFDELLKVSEHKLQVLLKHSYSCGTSFFAKKNVEVPELWADKEADLWIVDVIKSRGLSRTIAEQLEVHHESPQLLMIKDGTVLWHDSHGGVNEKAVGEFYQSYSEAED